MAHNIPGLKEAALSACETSDWNVVASLLLNTLPKNSIELEQLKTVLDPESVYEDSLWIQFKNIFPLFKIPFETNNIIFRSCVLGFVELLAVYVNSGFPINFNIGKPSCSLLHVAALSGHINIIKYLLSCGADLFSASQDFLTNKGGYISTKNMLPVHFAGINGHLDIVKYLLAKGSLNIASDKQFQIVLQIAVKTSKANVLEFLLENGCRPFPFDENGGIPLLHTAIMRSDTDCVKLLMKHCGTGRNYDPLHVAIAFSEIDTIQALLDCGMDVDTRDSTGDTPLLSLLQYHVDNIYTHTRLFEKLNFLLSKNANINLQCRLGLTPLHYAIQITDPDLIYIFLENGLDVNVTNAFGHTALFYLCRAYGFYPIPNEERNNAFNCAGILINYGADISITLDRGCSVLHWAAFHGSVHLVQRLLEKGLDVHYRNEDGNKAIDLAQNARHEDVIKCITNYICK